MSEGEHATQEESGAVATMAPTPQPVNLGGKQASDFVDKIVHSPLERRLFQPGVECFRDEHERIKEAIRAAAEVAPPAIVPYIRELEGHLAWVVLAIKKAVPAYFEAYKQAAVLLQKMPTELLEGVYGFALCFFGGTYSTTLACIEAFKLCGWQTTKLNLDELYEEYETYLKAHAEDDLVDDDNDGIADVHQITTQELVERKLNLALETIDPEKVCSFALCVRDADAPPCP
jgi:hypothetical protein